MALVSIDMTEDELFNSIEPAPEAAEYTYNFDGFLENKENRGDANNGDGFNLYWPTKAGGKKVLAKFTIQDADPKANGKQVIYTGVVGTFSFAHLCKALPLFRDGAIDTEGAIGRQVKASYKIDETYGPQMGSPKAV